jgi:hypothetical protein
LRTRHSQFSKRGLCDWLVSSSANGLRPSFMKPSKRHGFGSSGVVRMSHIVIQKPPDGGELVARDWSVFAFGFAETSGSKSEFRSENLEVRKKRYVPDC